MIKLLCKGLFVLLLIVTVLLALLFYSPKFNHWLILQSVAMVPGLSIVKADGLLLSEMHLQGLKYQAEQTDISVESASYRLSLGDLLAKQVQFDSMHIEGVDVVLLESDEPVEQDGEAFTFVMPITLRVNDFSLSALQVQQSEAIYSIESLKLALLYQRQQLQLSQFSLVSDMAQLQGEAELQLEGKLPFVVDLMIAKSMPERAEIKARLQLQGDSQKIYLDADILTPNEVHAQGWINLSKKLPDFDLQLDWSLLQWPLQGEKQYASENAQLTLQGTAEDYFLSLDSDVFTQDLAAGKLHLAGQGNSEQFTLNTLTLKALAGEIQSKGRISWTDSISSQLQLLVNNIMLPSALVAYSSELSLDAQVSGQLFNNPDFRVDINKLNGKVLDKELNAKAKIHYSTKQLLIEQLQANVGDNSLAVQGTVGKHNSVNFTLNAVNLHELSSNLYGSVSAEGALQGSINEPILQLELQSGGLKFQQQQLGSLQANGNLEMTDAGQLDLNVKAQQLIFNGVQIDKLEFQSSGQYVQHDLRTLVSSESGELKLAMQGGWNPQTKKWQGQIQQLKLQHESAGSWQLIQAAPLQMKFATQAAMQLQTDLCLAQLGDTGLVCLLAKADQHKEQILKGSIKQLPLSILSFWLPETVQIDSHLQAEFFLQNHSGLQGNININLDPGSIRMDYEQTGLQIVPFKVAEFDAKLVEDDLQSDVSIVFNDANYIEGQVKVTDLQDKAAADIDGLLDIQLDNIDFISAFIDSASELAGEVNAQLRLQGLLSAPQFNGSKVQLTQGKVLMPEMGLQVDDINIELSHGDQQQIALQAKAKIAKQAIVIDGEIDQYLNEQLSFKVMLKGENLQVMQVPEMQVWVSPDLYLKGDKRGARLEGELGVPKATLIFESLPEGAVALSDDEVIITDTKSEPKVPGYALDADINVQLGKSVSLEGFGLKTRLQGQLRAVQKKNQLKLYNTLSSVKGTYQAYGQDLSIEKGQLLFSGDMENPGVNILASRKASDWDDKTIAYLRMTGTLKDPVTTIYTVPALSESESLAYLLTGAPLGKSDSSNAALYAAAAMSLGRDYIDALMGVVGIDEFDMKSTSLGQNSMVIGKRISSDLYARYIMDVLTSQMQFAVIYKLTQNISIETRAGTTHSSDIRYNIEFD